MKILATVVLALLLHFLLGWQWTLLAGVVAGVWTGRGGWRAGAAGVGLGWLAFVGYDYAVAARSVQVMLTTLGGILGNLPGPVIVALTLLVGVLLGALGGALGTQLRLLVRREPSRI